MAGRPPLAYAANASELATVHGYAIGARWAHAILLLAAVIGFVLIRTDAQRASEGATEAA
jgi:UPF0716 family protein affecting phage T7 exclusion